jgi:methylmalonyl-CoA mutase
MNTAKVDSATLDRSAPDEPEHLALVDGPPPDRAAWVAAVDQVLRRARRIADTAPAGAGVEALTWSTLDGIAVRPLYTADDAAELPDTGVPGARPFVRGARPGGAVPDGWDVRTWHTDPDPREALLADLANGATSIWLAVGAAGTAVADLPKALDGVLLDLAPVVLDTSASPAEAEAAAQAYLELGSGRVGPAALLGTLGLDPVGVRARTGSGPDVESVVPLALRVSRDFPLVRAVVVDGLPVHAAGGSDAQELGYVVSAGVAYLRALTAAGLGVDAAARLLELRLAVTAEQFPTVAKLRAARRLWARVLEASGADLDTAPETAPAVHAVASPTMYTRRDPYVNLLRGTVAGFAAGVGGADAVTVAPFDAALGSSTPFSRRIARNTQSLLVMEAHLARVIDPAGGSWFVESLTDELARAAWAFFQELEAAGGVVAALDSGLVADRTAAVRAGRETDAATRRAPVTGVSEFPDLHEKPVPRSGPDLLAALGLGLGRGLPVYRPAAAYEAFRDRSDVHLAATGARPRAFLATLGPLATHAARAGFTRNLLHAGGIDTVDAGPTEAVDDVVAAFRDAGTPVAVLCSSDALYAERAAPVVAGLRAAGARHVLLAGKARVDGVDGHLAAGGDALAALDGMYAAIDPKEVAR